jgi:pSer/pThr/pTyr-binding forkhead associated (FHA) protein
MKLIIEDDEGRKTVVPFVRDEITIGRQEGNTIRLTERNVSRRHARLLRQNGHILVEDLGSYNGIRINGDRIQGQVQINEGDLIQIGDYDLAVQREGQEAAQARPTDKTQEVEPHRTNGASNAPTIKMPEGATAPALQAVADSGATLADEPEEADPDDVTSAPAPIEDAAAKKQSTAIIRMDQVEQNRPRQIAELDATEAPRLVVLNTELAGKEYACVRTELKVGRTDDNDIALDHRSLSRTHCKIVREDNGEWRVIDMQSANGLMVNGESYAQSALRNGDVLELGHVKLKFIGAGERFDAADVAATSGGSSKAPMFVAIATVVIAVGAAAAWFALHRTPHVKPPPPAVDPVEVTQKNPAEPVKPPPPVELTPEQQRAQVEAKLKEAQEKIDALEWGEARKILEGCFVGDSLHPEATKLIVELKSEEPLRNAIDKAEQLIENDKLLEAKEQLDSAAHTRFLQKRLAEVQEKLKAATQKKLQESTVARNPVPQPVAQPPPQPPKPVPPPAAKEAEALYEEARVTFKGANYPKTKETLLKCIRVDKTYADCHKLMGATLGQMGDGSGGAKEYEMFLKYAPPDHPSISKVKQLLDQYHQSGGK